LPRLTVPHISRVARNGEAGSVIRQYLLCHNPGMSALLATLVGGALAIAGGLVGVFATDRRERSRWRRDAQLRISTELLSSLQEVIRQMIDLAYLAEKPPRGSPEYAAYHKATIGWNSSIYAALLVSPPQVVDLVQDLDREVDRLLDRALEKPWSRTDFREERRALGRLAADYLNASRVETGWSSIPLKSVWAWGEAAPSSAAPSPNRDRVLPPIPHDDGPDGTGRRCQRELIRSPYRPRIRIVQPS
jgi:hypothetical protein